MHRLVVVLALFPIGRAAAQPVDPYAPEMPVAPPAVEPLPWSPVDDEGWPKGVSLEHMRGLRPCDPGESLPGPGARIPCRPALHLERPQWRLQIDWTTGLALGDARLRGGAQALGAELDVTLGGRLAVGARYELMGIGLRDDASGRSQRFYGQLRWRAFTDEVDRDGFTLFAGAGYALQGDGVGGDALLARAGVSREVGLYLDDENALTSAIELAYTRSFGEPVVDTLTASLRFGFELNIAEPGNLDTREEPPRRRLWTGVDLWGSPFMVGIGASVGVRLVDHVHLVETTSWGLGRGHDSDDPDDYESAWATQAGLRVDGGWPGPAPLYLQVQAGPGRIASPDGPRTAVLADAELGIMFGSCDGMVAGGARLRAEVEDGVDVIAGGFVLRMGFGAGATSAPMSGCGRGGDRGEPVVYMPTEPPPPPPPPVYQPPPPPPAVVAGGSGSVGGGAAVGGGGSVVVEVPRPRPIVLDVTIGASLLGGFVQVRVDPRMLPLDRLRGVDFDVRLEGPSHLLGGAQAELRAIFGRERIAVSAWSAITTVSQELRAVFTIYPPGSR